MTAIDFLGLSAGGLVLLTFATPCPRRLRRFAIGSNLLFIAYGASAGLWPILALHAVLLPINLAQLDRLARPGGTRWRTLGALRAEEERRNARMGLNCMRYRSMY
ncbi:MAG: hypothetical protein ACFBWO_06950 [Paracoccaceae bacterium]